MSEPTELALAPVLPVFRAVVETVVPEASRLDPSGWRDLEALVAGSLAERPSSLQKRLRLFLRLVQWLPALRYGRRFTALDPDRRARTLEGLAESRVAAIRVGFWGLRALALMGYYGRGATAVEIGYAPDPRGWEARR